MNESSPMSEFDEQAFDVLLGEAMGHSTPPDLTDRILQRWQQGDVVERSNAASKASVQIEPRRSSPAKGRFSSWGWLLAVGAVIATLMFSGWLFQGSDAKQSKVAVSSDSPSTGLGSPAPMASPDVDAGSSGNSAGSQQIASAVVRPRAPLPEPIELPGSVSDRGESDLLDMPVDTAAMSRGQRIADAQPKSLTLVSQSVGQSLSKYWDQLSIEPTLRSSDRDWWEYWSTSLGVTPPPIESAPDPQQWTALPSVRRAIATKWMAAVFGREWKRMGSEKRDELIDSLVDGKDLSKTVSAWVRDPSHPIRTAGGQAASSRRMASFTLAADLRCNRCHDGLIDRSVTQADHWSFVSVLDRPLKDVFYERLDGRRIVAKKQLPTKWVSGDRPVESAVEFADSLSQSRRFATGVVDSLWASLFGRPPHGSVVDFDAVVQMPAIESMRNEFIDDLMASDFDLSRLAALMMDSPAGHRTVPAMYRDGSWAISDRGTSERQIDAFAALPPVVPTGNLGERIVWNLRAMGRTIDGSRGPLLAQMRDAGNSDRQPGPAAVQPVTFGWNYPDGASKLPATWLQTIPDAKERLNHLAYLDGRSELPGPVVAAAAEMAKTSVDESLRLNRIWWMLQE